MRQQRLDKSEAEDTPPEDVQIAYDDSVKDTDDSTEAKSEEIGNKSEAAFQPEENAERNLHQMKEDNETNRIAHRAELMVEVAALQIVLAGMTAKDAEVMAVQEEA